MALEPTRANARLLLTELKKAPAGSLTEQAECGASMRFLENAKEQERFFAPLLTEAELTDRVKHMASIGNWQAIRRFLLNADWEAPYGYYLDSGANVGVVGEKQIEEWLEEATRTL